MIRSIHVAILVLTIGCSTARPSKKDAFVRPQPPAPSPGLNDDFIVDRRQPPREPVKETTYRKKKEFTGVPQNLLDAAAVPVAHHARIGDRKKESKQANRMLPYVAIGYGKRSAEAAGLNRTINPPPYYGKRSAEAVGLPAAPVADAAYVRKEPFREARQEDIDRYYPQDPIVPYPPHIPVEVVYRRPKAPVAIASKNKIGGKQARMIALNPLSPQTKKVVVSQPI